MAGDVDSGSPSGTATMKSALEAPGVAVDVDALLALRHLARDVMDLSSQTVMPGGFISRRRGRGLETEDIRVFEDGDDIRHIDRNATARTGTPHVRTFRDERDQTTLLLADFRPAMLWGTRRAFRSVAAAEVLALIGWRAMVQGGRVGLIALGGPEPIFVPARGRERGMVSVIGGLADAHRAALVSASEGRRESEPVATLLTMADQIAPRGAAVYVASSLDTPGVEFEASLTALAHRTDVSVLHVCDAFERAPPVGTYAFETENGRRGVGRVSDAMAEDKALLGRLAALGIPVQAVDADRAPDAMTGRGLGRGQ